MRLDDIALFVADVIASPLRVLDAENLAVAGANAHREDAQAFLRRLLRRLQRTGIVVLTVREEDQHLVVVALLVGGERSLNRIHQGRAALGNNVHIERLDALAEGRVVYGQRALQEGAAGEGDQAQAVGFGALHQIERGELGPGEAVRRDVRRQHAFRGVNRHNDVQPPLLDLLPVEPPLRPSQGQEKTGHRRNEAGRANLLARRGDANGQPRQQARLDELREQLLPLATGPPEEGQQDRRQSQQQPERMRVGKRHGSLLQTVWRRRTSSSSRPRPGRMNQASSSS